jgi:hypothetical protein
VRSLSWQPQPEPHFMLGVYEIIVTTSAPTKALRSLLHPALSCWYVFA